MTTVTIDIPLNFRFRFDESRDFHEMKVRALSKFFDMGLRETEAYLKNRQTRRCRRFLRECFDLALKEEDARG